MRDKNKIRLAFGLALLVCGVYVFYKLSGGTAGYLLYRRLPRLAAMILVAVAIATSTTLFQSLVNNRILTPDLLGYSQMYVFIQTFLAYGFGAMNAALSNPYLNFILVCGIMLVFSFVLYRSVLKYSRHNLYFLLLVGTVLNTLFRSVSSFFQLLIDPNEFSILQNSLIASFNSINTNVIYLAALVLLLPVPWVLKHLKEFDVIQLGGDYARTLGVDQNRLQRQSLIVISLLVSVSTALVGPIVFLGILVVNLSRMMITSYRHRYFLAFAIALSIIMIVGGQFIVDKVFTFSVTLPVLLNLIGGSYMIYLIMKERTV